MGGETKLRGRSPSISLAFMVTVVLVLTMTVGSYYCKVCDTVNVTLSLSDYCDTYPEVTAHCSVGNSNQLTWAYYSSRSKRSCLALCPTTQENLVCIPELTDGLVNCSCSNNVIMSEVKFNFSDPGVILQCQGPDGAENVSASIPSLNPPVMSSNYTFIDVDFEKFEVLVSWKEGEDNPINVEYVLSVRNNSSPKPMEYPPNNHTNMNIILYHGSKYTIVVVAQLCGGKLSSNASNELNISSGGSLSSISVKPTSSMIVNNNKNNNNGLNQGTVAGAVFSVILLFVIGVIIIVLVFIFWLKVKKKGNLPLHSIRESATMNVTNGAAHEMDTKESQSKELSGVAAILYVDSDSIYYSGIENKEHNKSTYYVIKCNYNGVVNLPAIECQGMVRGIAKDDDGYIYVSCSEENNSHINKYDSNGILIKSSTTQGRLGTVFGLIVTSEKYVLLCTQPFATRDKTNFFLFDNELNIIRNIKLDLPPSDITRFNNRYFISCVDGIMTLDIDTQAEFITNGNIIYNTVGILRGITSSDKYIYVTNMAHESVDGGKLICLEYSNGALVEKWQNEGFDCRCSHAIKCRPCVVEMVSSINGTDTIIFSQGTYKNQYHIVEATSTEGQFNGFKKLFDAVYRQ